MSRTEYELEFEKHRREIPEKEGYMPSRTEIHGKKKESPQNPMKLITIFLAIFTLIPLLFLLYVLTGLFSPSISEKVPVEMTEVSLHEIILPSEHQFLDFT
ncbi:hypothetical protein DV702_03350 [Sporosarcina sp. PTS2304]|uniref:hypothetical protein n=1 Tax=Sporosarcina sp. PTS2304 TaxID=2283194 RepID=UPI000E0D6E0A|nr:hypothetical protein [Sporosarcina sp. PTS2304]AXH98845.1 hypothetical protein DV702_03350 [Sporosarcina sp. PTS2304]